MRIVRRLGLPLAAAILAWTPLPPAFVERVYATSWYPRVQPVLTAASNAVAFAWLDPLALLTVGVVYCQMHYGVDALAGLVMGAVITAVVFHKPTALRFD